MDFHYEKLFLSFGRDHDQNNKIHIDVEPFRDDPHVLADLFVALADTVISQMDESKQTKYEQQIVRAFCRSMKTRHETLEVTRTQDEG